MELEKNIFQDTFEKCIDGKSKQVCYKKAWSSLL